MRRITQHKRIWIGTSRNGSRRSTTSHRRRRSGYPDWSLWIVLIGAGLLATPLLGSAVASSFPQVGPSPLTVRDAFAAVTPLPFQLDAIESREMLTNEDLEEAVAPDDSEEPVTPRRTTYHLSDDRAPAPLLNEAPPGWRTHVLYNAYTKLGTAYRWGGEEPGGFDCSGFVKYVMEASGIFLPRTAREMQASTLPIDYNELKPGDLVFFRNPDHVGIYAGSGQFVHASSGQKRVTISSLDGNFYRRRYTGGGRVAE
ncbi:MAG: C40 family peptidase [Candidatus Hydrogenedentota bacterium]